MNKRKMIITLIVLLAIGFASVSTTLVINGVIGISSSKDNFNVIFTSAKLDNVRRNDFIDETKKTIKYDTNKLITVDDESILDYEVSNTSRIYDANVSISCEVPDNEYVIIKYEPKSMVVKAGETKAGNIKTKLIRSSVEDSSISIICTLSASATERDSLGNEYVDSNKIGGTIMELTYDEVNEEVTSGKIWDSDNIIPYVTKAVFEKELNPHETTDDLIFDISEAQDGSVMAYLVGNSDTLSTYIVENWGLNSNAECYDLYIQANGKIMANDNSNYLFSNFISLKTIEGLENLDTSNVTNMEGIFNYCESLTTLDLSNFDTSNVTNMNYMFYVCSSLTTIDLSSYDTENVTTMRGMFCDCSSLTALDVSNFNTSNATDIWSMFSNCSSLTTLDLSNFDTSKVINMEGMFSHCRSLTTIDLSNFDTRNVTNMEGIFYYCSSLATIDLSNFDTNNITDMTDMFNGCSSLTTLDLSGFNTSKVTSMCNMFGSMPSNATIKVKDATTQNWVLTSDNNRPTEWTTDNVIIKV